MNSKEIQTIVKGVHILMTPAITSNSDTLNIARNSLSKFIGEDIITEEDIKIGTKMKNSTAINNLSEFSPSSKEIFISIINSLESELHNNKSSNYSLELKEILNSKNKLNKAAHPNLHLLIKTEKVFDRLIYLVIIIIALAIIVAILLSNVSCQQSSESQTKEEELRKKDLALTDNESNKKELQRKHYKFETGNGSELPVYLDIDNNKVEGYILSNITSQNVKVNGTIYDNILKLLEYEEDGKVGGIYTLDINSKHVQGKWSKPNGKNETLIQWFETDSVEYNKLAQNIILKNKNKKTSSTLQQVSSNFWGFWRVNCSRPGYIKIGKANNIEMEVNSNQIYINTIAKFSEKEPNRLLLYLKNTSDLGVGGSNLPWANFSKEKPIASIEYLPSKKDEMNFSWYGFYNTKTLQHEWERGLDWSNLDKNFRLIKCNN